MGKPGRRVPRYQREGDAYRKKPKHPSSARPWRYSSAIAFDESQCIRADLAKQHYTVVPESAYYSMKLRCERCSEEFWFSAREQRVWYEQWGFWIDSVAKQCAGCGKLLRQANGRA